MEIYHLAMSCRDKNWSVSKTARDFNCSVGLVSENLRLAHAVHINQDYLNCETRQDALKKLNGSR